MVERAATTIPRAFNSAWISASVMPDFGATRLRTEQICMWLEHRATMPANPVRGERAGLADPLHQLHGSRRADLVTRGGLAD
jgi:hypothetical protein